MSTPDKIIPFSISRDRAIEILNVNLSNKKLLPKGFILDKKITDIVGVYVPFWLYSNEYRVNIKYKNKGKDGDFNNKFYGVLSNAKEREASVKFKLIPFDVNRHLSNDITRALEPFNYEELVSFDTAYLSGFLAQKYDVDVESGISDIDNRCDNSISDIFSSLKSKNYVSDIVMINKNLIKQDKCYAVLPIWLLNIGYNNSNYFIAINGQTGKVAGRLPIDKNKYSFIALLLFIIIFVILLIIVYVLRWGGLI